MVVFNECWYSEDQCLFLTTLVDKVRDIKGSIIENGCWEGKSTSYIANACYPENLICNDTWLGNVTESNISGVKNISEIIIASRDVYSIFLNNMNELTKGNYSVVKRDVLEWLKVYKDPIKFIHIDASHDYESVFETIQLALPNLVSGGIICGDDFKSAHIGFVALHGGVERAVRESFTDFKSIGNLWYWIKP